MEFILFLSKLDREILELVKKAEYTIEENTTLCMINKKFMGFHKEKKRTIVICTNNAKEVSNFRDKKRENINDNMKTKLYLRRALRHEATHLAQSCNDNKPTNLVKNATKRLHKSKLKSLKSSVQISGNLLKEVEAYVMEDKPRKVKEALEKYCF